MATSFPIAANTHITNKQTFHTPQAQDLFSFSQNTNLIYEEKDQRCIFMLNEQTLVKRSVYASKEKPNQSYVVFCKLPIVKTTTSSKCYKRDPRKFSFKENDIFLYVGVTDDKNQRHILHRFGVSPNCNSNCKCTQRRTDVPQEAFIYLGECLQGPFHVLRFGVARRERQSSGPRQRFPPNVPVVEILLDGHQLWVEHSFVYGLVAENHYNSLCEYSGVKFSVPINATNRLFETIGTSFAPPLQSQEAKDYLMIAAECNQKSLFNQFVLPPLPIYTSANFDQEPKMQNRKKQQPKEKNSPKKETAKEIQQIQQIQQQQQQLQQQPKPVQEYFYFQQTQQERQEESESEKSEEDVSVPAQQFLFYSPSQQHKETINETTIRESDPEDMDLEESNSAAVHNFGDPSDFLTRQTTPHVIVVEEEMLNASGGSLLNSFTQRGMDNSGISSLNSSLGMQLGWNYSFPTPSGDIDSLLASGGHFRNEECSQNQQNQQYQYQQFTQQFPQSSTFAE